MRILHVIWSVNPAGGGPVEGVKQREAVLRPMGHVIEIASLDGPDDEWVKDCPVKVYALGPGKGTYSYAPGVVEWIRDHAAEYDVVIVNGIWQYHSFAAWKALRGKSTPYYVFTHGMLDPWFNATYPLKKLKKALYWPWAEYRVLRDARAVFFTCEEEKVLARGSFKPYKVNEIVVNYGTAGPDVDLSDARTKFLEKFPELEGKRILLYLSRIHEKKGIDLLIEAFTKVSDSDPLLQLVVAGPDKTNLMPKLKEQAKRLGVDNRVFYPGMLTGELKWGAYAACEAFVLPSHQENFGIVVAEALACGRPVLISDKVNIWREIEADGAGLVEPDDGPGTTRLLQRWLAMSPAEKERMADNAIECFRDKFEITKAAESLLEKLEATR
ncbi:MAG: glycosyltransferase [Fimbriimonadaceae bacterium]|nr:glycosyltransferase [Fimbriimonadaceae bacterium]QYK57013.1 MAG: glycosyltransferase [Fimbriimonadaceae bacterium]